MERRHLMKIARHIAWQSWGQPYKWGGDDTIDGFDCSGFIMEILQSVGALKDKTDRTAQGLWEHYEDVRVSAPYDGCLVFYWNASKTKIIHVEFCLNELLKIGASGGGSKTTTKEAAAKHNAYVKVRPIKSRGNIAGYVDPFLETAPWGK